MFVAPADRRQAHKAGKPQALGSIRQTRLIYSPASVLRPISQTNLFSFPASFFIPLIHSVLFCGSFTCD